MADSLLARQAATYKAPKDQTPKHLMREQPAAPPTPRPMSQLERQALTYKHQSAATAKVEPGAFQKLKQETGLNDDQARKVVDWLLADEPKR